jgi:hypothetical protein
MEKNTHFHIYEEILLLALRDKKGTLFLDVHYQQALAGALLAELLLKSKIEIEYSGKKKFIKVVDSKLTGDALLDECIVKMTGAKRRVRIENWVQRFANIRRLKNRAAINLCRKGVLKQEESKIMFLFTRKIYPEVDPRPEKQLLAKLDKAIFGNSKEIDAETVILIAICNSTGILKHLFDKNKLKENKNRIKELTTGNLIGNATKEAVEAMQAAIMVAVLIPAISVAATS